jgi:hypothetical protein
MLHPRGERDANVAGRNLRRCVEDPDAHFGDREVSWAEESAQIVNPSMRKIVRHHLLDV